ncbi:hypothetical protein RRG08_013956 [Elysia crispata]|uniref:Uncharacterized protein n=1 Tax=Elysia crispata TaxID=231223 RepID=A0AAE1DPU9_9GAST|nr:hypothetical protein RRG08_013956 [Elysia crispata]
MVLHSKMARRRELVFEIADQCNIPLDVERGERKKPSKGQDYTGIEYEVPGSESSYHFNSAFFGSLFLYSSTSVYAHFLEVIPATIEWANPIPAPVWSCSWAGDTSGGKEEYRLFPPLVTHDDIFGPSSLSYSVVQQFGCARNIRLAHGRCPCGGVSETVSLRSGTARNIRLAHGRCLCGGVSETVSLRSGTARNIRLAHGRWPCGGVSETVSLRSGTARNIRLAHGKWPCGGVSETVSLQSVTARNICLAHGRLPCERVPETVSLQFGTARNIRLAHGRWPCGEVSETAFGQILGGGGTEMVSGVSVGKEKIKFCMDDHEKNVICNGAGRAPTGPRRAGVRAIPDRLQLAITGQSRTVRPSGTPALSRAVPNRSGRLRLSVPCVLPPRELNELGDEPEANLWCPSYLAPNKWYHSESWRPLK